MNPIRYRHVLSPTLLPHHRHPYSHRNHMTDRHTVLASAYQESSTMVIHGDFLSSEALQHPSEDAFFYFILFYLFYFIVQTTRL